MAEKQLLSPNELADQRRLKEEGAARGALNDAHRAMSDFELQAALADATQRAGEEDGVRRHASIICEQARRCAAVEAARPSPASTLASPPAAAPARQSRETLVRRHKEKREESIAADLAGVAAELPAEPPGEPLSPKELREIAMARNPRPPAVIHPVSVEPDPRLPPPLCVEHERIRTGRQ